jgi:hypothetical protein
MGEQPMLWPANAAGDYSIMAQSAWQVNQPATGIVPDLNFADNSSIA